MRAFARFVELELGPAGDDLFTEADERLDNVAQRQHFGPSATNGEHIGGEARLRLRMTPQLVEHDVCRRIAFQVDNDPHAFAARFVADVRNAFNPLVLGGFGDLFDQPGFADLERNAGQHDRAAVAFAFFDFMPRALHDRALALAIGRACAAGTQDQRAGGEIGGRDDLDQLINGDRGIVDIGEAGGDNFAQIMRRNVGRHADRNAASAVDQQIGEAGREDLRLFAAAVIVWLEIDGILVEIIEQRIGDLVQPRLGIAHRCGRIRVHRAEIALTIDQRHAQRPVLRHARQARRKSRCRHAGGSCP